MASFRSPADSLSDRNVQAQSHWAAVRPSTLQISASKVARGAPLSAAGSWAAAMPPISVNASPDSQGRCQSHGFVSQARSAVIFPYPPTPVTCAVQAQSRLRMAASWASGEGCASLQ